jgi:hypothetical protein
MSITPGTYYVRVQGSNVTGTAFSNQISFTIGAPCVAPTPPTSVVVSHTGGVINLSWGPPAAGSGPLAYTILAGTSSGLSNIGAFPR